MKKKGLAILVLTICLYFPSSAFAETIILKSGQKVEGKIIKKTDKYIQIDFPGVPLTYFLNEIESIDGQKLGSAKEDSGVLDIKKGEVAQETAKEAFDKGLAYLEELKLDEAIAEFSKAIVINPNYAEVYRARSIAYFEKNDLVKFHEDENMLDKLGYISDPKFMDYLLKKFPTMSYCLQGTSDLVNNDYDEAIANFNKALELNPNLAAAYLGRGTLYAQKAVRLNDRSSLEQAILDFQKMVAIEPNHFYGYFGLAGAYLKLKEPEKAITNFNKVIELSIKLSLHNPYLGQAYELRAEAYFAKKDFDKSWEDVHKAKSLGYKVPEDFLDELKKASGREK